MFSNAFCIGVVKNSGLCGKGFTLYNKFLTFNDPKEEGLGKH